jgi:hypothetical protein
VRSTFILRGITPLSVGRGLAPAEYNKLIFARKSTEIIHFSLFNIHYSLNYSVRVILSGENFTV